MFNDFGLRVDWNRLGTCICNAPWKARKCAYFPNARAIRTFLLNPPLRLQKGVIPAADLGSSTRGVDPAADPGSDPKLAPNRPGLGSPTSANSSSDGNSSGSRHRVAELDGSVKAATGARVVLRAALESLT